MPQRGRTAHGAPTLDGIVLAGGPGSRMGGPKACRRLGDSTLVERAVGMLAPHCRTVRVVARVDVPLPPLDVEVLFDMPGPDCPLTGIATGLAASTADDVLVLACDLPFAAPMLGALAAAPPGRAAIGRAEGRIQPLCARYPRAAALEAARDLLEAGRLRADGPALRLDADAVDDRWGALANLNTPDDLARAARLVASADQAG